jgi:hypothetical protein
MSWMSTPAMRSRDANVWRKSFQRKSAIFRPPQRRREDAPDEVLAVLRPGPERVGEDPRTLEA